MKYLLIIVLMVWSVEIFASHGNGNDDSDQATSTASCNASFQVGCPEVPTDGITSTSFAAPIGQLGETTLESIVILLVVGLMVRIRRRLTC